MRLLRAFRTEQADPSSYYTGLASDTACQLAQYADLDGRVVADVGGGPGFFVRELRSAGARAFCVDAEAGELAAQGRPESGSVLSLPLASGAVDVCLLEHVGDWAASLYAVSVTAALAWARSADGSVLIHALHRYIPGWSRRLVRVPVLREFLTWNLLLVLRITP